MKKDEQHEELGKMQNKNSSSHFDKFSRVRCDDKGFKREEHICWKIKNIIVICGLEEKVDKL